MTDSASTQPKRKPRHLFVWLFFFVLIAGGLIWIDVKEASLHATSAPFWRQLLFSSIGATLALGLWCAVRWAFASWRNVRRTLIGFAGFVTLIAIFYAVENWRGKRAWLQCKAELEAKGVVLDWDKYIPPTVPDDQNFFTVNTNFYLRFVKQQNEEKQQAVQRLPWMNLTNGFPVLDLGKLKPLVAEISVAASTDAKPTAIRLAYADAASQLQAALRNAVGRDANGSTGFKFTEFQIGNLAPAKITVLTDYTLTVAELARLIPATLFTNIGKLAVTATADPKIFQVRFIDGKVTSASDYLAWGNERYAADLDEVRAALKRPYALMPGDYAKAWEQPIPNFVTLRAMVQILAQRAQCYLLLGKPEKAIRELTLIHEVCAIVEKRPSGKPIILVEAMMNVAIHGLYCATALEGFRLNAWRDEELAAIQSQLADVDLPHWVKAAFAMEQASTCQLVETAKPSEIARLGVSSKLPITLVERFSQSPRLALDLLPRGWAYQNMVIFARLIQSARESIESKDGLINPQAIEKANTNISDVLYSGRSGWRPFHLVAVIAIPFSNKAMQTCAYNQTLVNQLQIVCALERYKLANGNYPDSLAALMPQFIGKIPNDIIGGKPLRYQRTADEKFLLWSVGWNETDDDGMPGTLADVKKGDWVWKN